MMRLLARLRELGRSFLDFRHLVTGSSVIFFLIVGSAVILIYQNAGVMRRQINSDFNQQQLSLAKQAVYQIEANLRDIELELMSLKGYLEADIGEVAIAKAMRAALARNRDQGLREVGVMDRRGRAVEALYAGRRRPEARPPACEKIAEDRMVLGPLLAEEKDPDRSRVTSVVCMRIASGGARGGLIFAKIDVSGLAGGVTRHIRSGRTGYAWVIDEKGIFLFHPEESFIGRSALEARKQRKPYISFAQINAIMKDRMLRGEEGAGEYVSGWHRGIEGEMAKLIGFAPVKAPSLPDGHAWSVAVVAPKSEVADAVHYVYIRNTAAGAAIVAGMFVFGLLVMTYQHRISLALRQRVEKTEADFHEMERIYERVVAQATDLIYILDLEMRVVLLNQKTMDILAKLVADKAGGRGEGDAADPHRKEFYLGRSFAELLEAGDVSFIRSKMDQLLATQSETSFEHTIELDGRRTRLSTKLVPIRDDQRRIRLILGIGRDITEEFEMDQRIYNTEKLASIGTLAAGVAHEINNPLGVILGFTDLLLEKTESGTPEYEDLKVIEAQATNAKKIVEKLLGFARITEGLEDIVDVKAALETVANIVSNTLMTKKMGLDLDVPDKLPKVRGDSREFQQVIFNLINNAIAAMDKEGGRIELKARVRGGWVHVDVKDSGAGIPESVKPRIFDPFFTTKKVGEGTGLGLSLCYGIVRKYGGRITFTSVAEGEDPGEKSGTTFTVSLPARGEGGNSPGGPGGEEERHGTEHPSAG
ncbi:MAG: ATP-binding protein [Elusimicrobiota bacterium]